MHPNVHRSNVHNSQTVEGDKMPFNRRMDKEDVVHTYKGILAIKKNEILLFVTTWLDSEVS